VIEGIEYEPIEELVECFYFMRNVKEGEVKERRELTEGIQRVEELVDLMWWNSIKVGISFANSGSSYFIPCLNESALRRQRGGG